MHLFARAGASGLDYETIHGVHIHRVSEFGHLVLPYPIAHTINKDNEAVHGVHIHRTRASEGSGGGGSPAKRN